jgi:predicted MFS family arabinose efflux permease
MIGNRWAVLGLLFFVRAAMALQFQSVAAVAPLMTERFGLGLPDIGLLIGLYFAPGIALALPGGALGRRLGDKTAVLIGLGLMLIGGAILLTSASWSGQVCGRLVAGTGGILLNVLMTKMIADCFVGREIATAMAIFVNSWPCGIGVSLLVLPAIGAGFGLVAVNSFVLLLVAAATLCFASLYKVPRSEEAASCQETLPDARSSAAVILVGGIWTLYNIGFAMIFSFGPAMLSERGWSMTAAGGAISIVLWLAVVSVPLGGFLSDYLKKGDLVLAISSAAFAILLYALPRSEDVLVFVVVLGLLCGLPVGPIMALPAQFLKPGTRALGMGLFYTVFNVGMLIGPLLGGGYASWTGGAAGAFDFGAIVLALCPVALLILRWQHQGLPPLSGQELKSRL